MTSGCSGDGEDVRVALCKDMAELLAQSARPVVWQDVQRHTARFEDQVITVRFQTADGHGQVMEHEAACHYAFSEPDEEYNTSSVPATHYATNPHRMTLDGRSIVGRELSDAVHAAMAGQGRDFLGRVLRAISGFFGNTGKS